MWSDNSTLSPVWSDNSTLSPIWSDNSTLSPMWSDNSTLSPMWSDNSTLSPMWSDNDNSTLSSVWFDNSTMEGENTGWNSWQFGSQNHQYLKAGIITAIGLTICVINTLSLYLLGKTWMTRRWQDSIVMLALFSTDLLHGLTTITMSACAAWQPHILQQDFFPKVHIFFYNLCGSLSLIFLAGASVVQAVAVVRPLHLGQMVTVKRMTLGLLMMFLAALTLAISGVCVEGRVVTAINTYIPFVQNKAYNLSLIYVYYGCGTLVILCCYGLIFQAVLKQKRQIDHVGNANYDNNISAQTVLAAIKSAKKIFVIILLYFVLYLPAALTLVSTLGLQFYNGLPYFFCIWLQVCNSFCNSLVYVAMNRHMRQALAKMFRQSWSV